MSLGPEVLLVGVSLGPEVLLVGVSLGPQVLLVGVSLGPEVLLVGVSLTPKLRVEIFVDDVIRTCASLIFEVHDHFLAVNLCATARTTCQI